METADNAIAKNKTTNLVPYNGNTAVMVDPDEVGGVSTSAGWGKLKDLVQNLSAILTLYMPPDHDK